MAADGDNGDLLQQLAAAQGMGDGLQGLLAAEQLDPRTRMIAQLLMSRRAEEQDDDAPPARSAPTDRERRMARKLKVMRAEIERLRDLQEALADALGACPDCFGDDADCRECAGHGVPGSAEPDRELFQRVVVPAMRRADAARHREARSRAIEQQDDARPDSAKERTER